MSKLKLVRPLVEPSSGPTDSAPEAIAVGQWYWVKSDSGDEDEPGRWFGCVTHLGTNYARLEAPGRGDRSGGSVRIHFDEFWETCSWVADPGALIDGQVDRQRQTINALLDRVRVLTATLAVGPTVELGAGSETQALAIRGQEQDMDAYAAALVRAKTKELPELFKQIEETSSELAKWMSARVVPLRAEARALQGTIALIEDRIFHVELYAGLIEEVRQLKDGAPAPLTEKVRLFQRRCYMDEECLAQYRTGGMVFDDIGDFDQWLIAPDNLARLLPMPRCVVAFRVRRYPKKNRHEGVWRLSDYIRIMEEERWDKLTFLYMRNGEQVYRLSTEIEFGERLFPDLDYEALTGKLYARTEFAGSRIDKLITAHEWQAMVKQEEDEHAKEIAAWEALPKKSRGFKPRMWSRESERYVPYDRSHTSFDDITKKIQGDMKEHNRVAILMQGLLDRSPVFQPHPPWQLWTSEGFGQAIELVHDDARALTTGEPPDFEAYRARVNASIGVGSVTVGQEDQWERQEAERLNAQRRRERRLPPLARHRPHGDPGPGIVARVASCTKDKCTFAWARRRRTTGWREAPDDDLVKTTVTVDVKHLLHVDAYKPGDFRIFFDDPRTRAEYIKWAPLLLEAEEYHAGNRPIRDESLPQPKRRQGTWESRLKHERQKKRKRLKAMFVGQAVRFTCQISTRDGTHHKKGSLWRVGSLERGGFHVYGIHPDGSRDWDRSMSGLSESDLELAPEVSRPPPRSAPQARRPEPDDEDDEDDA